VASAFPRVPAFSWQRHHERLFVIRLCLRNDGDRAEASEFSRR
jgi:hypothetical protein